MISVIFSTRENKQSHIDHIKKTSGLGKNIEVIQYINPRKNIGEVYNDAIKKSTYDIIVFCDENIKILTKNWGKKLLKILNTTEHNILGVSGAWYIPSNWLWWKYKNNMIGNISSIYDTQPHQFFCGNFQNKIIDSVVVDSNLFIVNKNKLESLFNEDISNDSIAVSEFCINNFKKNNIGVLFDIKISQSTKSLSTDTYPLVSSLPFKIKPRIVNSLKKKKLKKEPKLAIIIPTKGYVDILKECIISICEKDEYINKKIYIADTGSSIEDKERIKNEILIIDKKIELVEFDYYNFASINNEMVNSYIDKDTDILLFSNNDIQLINNAITRMVEVYNKNKHIIGTIGCRLYYPDNTIQCGGIYCMLDSLNLEIKINHYGHLSAYGYKHHNINVIGNTGAFLLTNKKLFQNMGGFNEKYSQCFEDVEYSLKLILNNKTNILVNDAISYHKESLSRNSEDPNINKDFNNILYPFIDKNIKKLIKHMIIE